MSKFEDYKKAVIEEIRTAWKAELGKSERAIIAALAGAIDDAEDLEE